MSVQIGAKPDSGFDDPLGMLKDCHRRIEHFLGILRLVAERATGAGVKQVVFDRGGYKYHGRVAAMADAARQAGLEF